MGLLNVRAMTGFAGTSVTPDVEAVSESAVRSAPAPVVKCVETAGKRLPARSSIPERSTVISVFGGSVASGVAFSKLLPVSHINVAGIAPMPAAWSCNNAWEMVVVFTVLLKRNRSVVFTGTPVSPVEGSAATVPGIVSLLPPVDTLKPVAPNAKPSRSRTPAAMSRV